MAKRMKPAIKAQWVAALRSGKYRQTQGQLREVRDDESNKTLGFCCLGVLCNLHAQAHPRIAASQTDPGQYLGEIELLPEAVRKWAGLPEQEHGARLVIGGQYDALTDHNDNGRTFKQIAKAIEAQL